MTASERAALARLARHSVAVTEVRRDHAEKFINHGLAVKQALRLRITPKGQLEVLRQRFRRMSTRTVHINGDDFRTRFNERLRQFRAADPPPGDGGEDSPEV
jgi:hypothetical protein